MKKVLFIFNHGRIERYNKNCPDEFFYGLNHLNKKKYDVDFLSHHPTIQGLSNSRGSVFEVNAFTKKTIYQLKYISGIRRISQILPALSYINQQNILIPVNDEWIFALSFLKKMRIIKPQIVGVTIGPYERKKNPVIKKIQKILFKGIKLIVLSKPDYDSFSKYYFKDDNLYINFFGVDTHFWKPSQKKNKSKYVFSIGTASRDYDTLISAWSDIKTKLKIITSALSETEKYSKNIEVTKGLWNNTALSDEDILELYQNSKYVVIPIKNSTGPQGQSAILQAMSCGKAVIMTNTDGLFDKTKLKHMENCVLIKPHDVDEMEKAIKLLESSPELVERIGLNARQLIIKYFSSKQFAKGLEEIIEND